MYIITATNLSYSASVHRCLFCARAKYDNMQTYIPVIRYVLTCSLHKVTWLAPPNTAIGRLANQLSELGWPMERLIRSTHAAVLACLCLFFVLNTRGNIPMTMINCHLSWFPQVSLSQRVLAVSWGWTWSWRGRRSLQAVVCRLTTWIASWEWFLTGTSTAVVTSPVSCWEWILELVRPSTLRCRLGGEMETSSLG